VVDEPEHVASWVTEHQRRARETGPPGVTDIAQAAPHPTRDVVACTVTLRSGPDDDGRRVVALVDAGGMRPLLGAAASGSPVWSPDGGRLAVLASYDGGLVGPVVLDADGAELARAADLGGAAESVRWSPDGDQLALVVAEPGAEISDVWGSGVVGGANSESWRPQVFPHEGGRRRLVVWDVGDGRHRVLTDLNVWEADWCGADLVALVSDGAGEDAWYAATVVRITLGGEVARLHEERFQLARPSGSPDGSSWSVLTGFASDRDLLAGALVVAGPGHAPAVVETAGVHVTEHRWVAPSLVLVIGHRGLETAVGTVDVTTGEWRELWSGGATTGTYQPELGGLAADGLPVLVLEQHDLPPTLVHVGADGEPRVLLSSAGPGTDHVRAAVGPTRAVTWTSVDGLAMEGLVDLPHGEAPYPLVVQVHGGPVGAYQDGWIGRDPHTTVLVARGYAVFRPNPRGSAGRGAEFAEAVLGDMGGRDVRDVLSGVDELVAQGLVDRNRVGVTGQSYGGFMACWMPCLTDLFAASVSRSPCTDWRSFHLTSNIAEFGRLFLQGDPFDAHSQYQTRNPLTHHARIRTPMLLTAGALDLATPASQAQQMHRALAEHGVETSLAIYPEEGHGVQAAPALVDQLTRMVAWFERFMPVSP
jgi:dipeptidyl aminopeptidase/acylaminoacyl peptidase